MILIEKLKQLISIIEGVRGDIAFAQAILETNYFRFRGTVKPGQNNFAGIGATGPGQSGVSFANPKLIMLRNHFRAGRVILCGLRES